MSSSVQETLKHFSICGDLIEIAPFKSGRINESYLSRWRDGSHEFRLLHQRINDYVFKDVARLMENIRLVTDHLRKKINAKPKGSREETLSIVPTCSGNVFHRDAQGKYWRVYNFIEEAKTYDICPSASHAYQAALCSGRFINYLSDLDPSSIFEVIPFFHHTPKRIEALEHSINLNSVERVKSAAQEIAFVQSRRAFSSLIAESMARHELQTRVIHYDPKVNNILFDTKTDLAIGLVDLDTCMPGTLLYDFGDLARSAIVKADEDESDLSKVALNMEYFRKLACGFIDGAAQLLQPSERQLLHLAPRLIALTLGIRFLTDYLDGDKYFKVSHPQSNLERCRVQFRAVEMMESCESEMREAVR